MDPLTLLTAGTSIYGAIANRRKTNAGREARAINARYMQMNPGVSLSGEDQAFLDRLLATGTRTASRSAQMGRGQARRQIAARGLYGASAAALLGGVDEQEAALRQQAADANAKTAYDLGSNNRDFARQKLMTAWGAELGASRADLASADARNAGMWNAITQAAPLISGAWGAVPTAPSPGATTAAPAGAPAPGGAGGATYNPSLSPVRRSVGPM